MGVALDPKTSSPNWAGTNLGDRCVQRTGFLQCTLSSAQISSLGTRCQHAGAGERLQHQLRHYGCVIDFMRTSVASVLSAAVSAGDTEHVHFQLFTKLVLDKMHAGPDHI